MAAGSSIPDALRKHRYESENSPPEVAHIMARIIMADDDELVCELVADALRAHGHAVGFLDNGDDALKVLKARQPDLAILDCNMPGLSGMLLIRAIRDCPALYDMPVLMLTGRTSKRDRDLAIYEGANAYMTKPFDPEELAFRVDELLEARPKKPEPPRFARRA